MKKKGETTISTLIGWAVGILVLFIILFIMFGPTALVSKAKAAIFSFG